MLVIFRTDMRQGWLARQTLPAGKMKLLAGRITSLIKECCNPQELGRPMEMAAIMYQHSFVPTQMPELIIAIAVTFSSVHPSHTLDEV